MKLIASGLALAAPVVVALWLTDLALGLIARAAPQVPVYFVGLPLKGLLAIGVVLVRSRRAGSGAGRRFRLGGYASSRRTIRVVFALSPRRRAGRC